MAKKEKAKFTATKSPAIDRTGTGDQHSGSFPAGHSGERASFVKGRGTNRAKPESSIVRGNASNRGSGRETKPVVPRAK